MNVNSTPGSDQPILHWIFTKEEWRLYKRMLSKSKGLFARIAMVFNSQKLKDPHVTITENAVQINGRQNTFRDINKNYTEWKYKTEAIVISFIYVT